MPKACITGFQILTLRFILCASLSLLTVTATTQTSKEYTLKLEKRSLQPSSTTAANISSTATTTPSDNSLGCRKLPITPDTWKLLNIDDMLQNLPGGQNLTIAQFASANNAGNFICGIGEFCNAAQQCHPVKAPAWQVLYATQQYNVFMNSMVDSINYALSQLQSISASMANDLSDDIQISRLTMNLDWLFKDLYRGIAYGATTLLIISVLATSPLGSLLIAANILFLTTAGAALAAWIQGAPKTASFVPWTNLGFYIAQAQEKLAVHFSEVTESTFNAGITSEKGLANVLSKGQFFMPTTPGPGPLEVMEKSILRIVQGRLLARLLRGQNAYITISQSECNDKGPGGARGGHARLSYCDPKEKLLFNIVRAHKRKTINTIIGADAITTKYGFSVEYIVRNSWECQEKYRTFEHDTFADISKLTPENFTSTECVVNLPVCDMRIDDIRNLKYGKHKTTTLACRKGGTLPI